MYKQVHFSQKANPQVFQLQVQTYHFFTQFGHNHFNCLNSSLEILSKTAPNQTIDMDTGAFEFTQNG